MKILFCVQARMGSSRLPGKVMMPLAGRPLLQRMVERVRAAKLATHVVVLTTTDNADDEVVKLCDTMQIDSFRGSPTDLLDRHYQAALLHDADAVVKIPSDCPLIDPTVIDRITGFYVDHAREYDFVSNLHPASYPDGNDVEIMPIGVLREAWSEATKPFEREHTTPFIWERPERYRIANIEWETGRNCSMTHRWTIDYPEDYDFIAKVYDELFVDELFVDELFVDESSVGESSGEGRRPFGLNDILSLIERKPAIAAINQKYAGVNWYRHHLNQLKTISTSETRLVRNET